MPAAVREFLLAKPEFDARNNAIFQFQLLQTFYLLRPMEPNSGLIPFQSLASGLLCVQYVLCQFRKLKEPLIGFNFHLFRTLVR